MTVLEMRSQTGSLVSWSEVCGSRHHPAGMTQGMQEATGSLPAVEPSRVRGGSRTIARPATIVDRRPRVAASRASSVSARPAEGVSVGPGRRISPRVNAADRPRACHVRTTPTPEVADDVPTWVLLTCGIVLGVMMLLAMAYIGGPSYA